MKNYCKNIEVEKNDVNYSYSKACKVGTNTGKANSTKETVKCTWSQIKDTVTNNSGFGSRRKVTSTFLV